MNQLAMKTSFTVLQKQIVCQNVKLKLVTGDANDVTELIAALIEGFDPQHNDIVTWFGSFSDVNAGNLFVWQWQNILSNLYFWTPHLSESSGQRVAQCLVRSVLTDSEATDTCSSGTHSMRTLSVQYMSSAQFQESALMQNYFVTALWSHLGDKLKTTSPRYENAKAVRS